MKYMISQYGAGVAVGLLDSKTAEEDINLSHNLFNTYANDNFFNGVLCFTGVPQFYKFLIYKNIFVGWDPRIKYSLQLKEATNTARATINKEVSYRNFMTEVAKSDETRPAYRVVRK
jgi:hypothetical protein